MTFLEDMADKHGLDPWDHDSLVEGMRHEAIESDQENAAGFRVMSAGEVEEADRANDEMHRQWLASTCPCEKPDDNYILSIDMGDVELRHVTCGKRPRWEDWREVSYSNEIPVEVTWSHQCDCNPYVTLGHECGPEVQITFPERKKT